MFSHSTLFSFAIFCLLFLSNCTCLSFLFLTATILWFQLTDYWQSNSNVIRLKTKNEHKWPLKFKFDWIQIWEKTDGLTLGMPKFSKMLPSFSFSKFENFRELPSKDSRKYNALILILEFREFSRITLKRFSGNIMPSFSFSNFENYSKTLENFQIFIINNSPAKRYYKLEGLLH